MLVADMPSLQFVSQISFHTPLSELLIDNDVYSSIYDILAVRYMLDDLNRDAIENLDTAEVTTVGALIDFLLENRNNTAAPLTS